MKIVSKRGLSTVKEKKTTQYVNNAGGGGVLYCLGLVGALVYYVQQSDGFWPFIGAILKAIVWPAFLVYDLLQYIGS